MNETPDITIHRSIDPAIDVDGNPPADLPSSDLSSVDRETDVSLDAPVDPSIDPIADPSTDPTADPEVDAALEAVPEAARLDARPFRERLTEDESVQAVAFGIGGEVHACDILLVEEIVTRQKIHRLPDMPARLLGVLRLRGELVPVLDVSPALDLALSPEREPAVMIVSLDEARVGVAADAVHEVVALPHGSLRPAPLTGGDRDQYVLGVARVDGRLLNLIDLAEILRAQTTFVPGENR